MKTYKCKNCKEKVPHAFCYVPNMNKKWLKKYSCSNCGHTEEKS